MVCRLTCSVPSILVAFAIAIIDPESDFAADVSCACWVGRWGVDPQAHTLSVLFCARTAQVEIRQHTLLFNERRQDPAEAVQPCRAKNTRT